MEVLAIDNRDYFFRLSNFQETDGDSSLLSTLTNPWYMHRGYDTDHKTILAPEPIYRWDDDR